MDKVLRRYQHILPVLLIVFLCLLSRLPQLLSNKLLLDSDECIVALMAKHMCAGKSVPVFFYGQSYGFSLVETGMISLFSLPAGMTDISVKLSMLCLWAAGVLFFYFTLKENLRQHTYLPLFVTVLLVLCPEWAVWSMKARGGYLTAFTLSMMVTWLLLRRGERRAHLRYLLIGISLVVIYYSQPLWLPGLLPFIIYAFVQRKSRRELLFFTGGVVLALAVFVFLKYNAADYWKSEVFQLAIPSFKDVGHACSLLTDHFNAWYYLDSIYASSFASRIAGGMQIALLITVMGGAVFFVCTAFRNNYLLLTALAAVVVTLGYSLLLSTDAPRYLLPLGGFMLFAFALLLDKIDKPGVIAMTGIPIMITGAAALWSFKDYMFAPFSEEQLRACIAALEQHKVKYVFSNDGLLEWQLMYYSGERITCRESSMQDRLPHYVQEVNNAYRNERDKTAVVDFYGDLRDMAPDKAIMAGDIFAIVLQPDEQLLHDMEFEF